MQFAINILFRLHWEQVEPHHRNLLDEVKTLGFLVITFSLFHIRDFSLVCFLFQIHLCVNSNKVRTILILVISRLILVGKILINHHFST